MKKSIFPVLVILLLSVVVACKKQTTSTDTLSNQKTYSAMDARGVQVELDQPAQRVVVLFEAFVDAMFMLEAQDLLVGVPSQVYLTPDSYEFFSSLSADFASKKIATPSFNGRSVNMESLVALQPDLVVTFSEDSQMIAQMESLGMKVYAMIGSDIEVTLKEFEGLGNLVGKSERSKMITSYIREQIQQMSTLVPEQRKSAYYVWSKGRVLSTSGKGTLMDSAITLADVDNACPLQMEAPNIGVELLYQWNPDLMILWNTPESDVYGLKELANLPAVVNKQVFEMKPIFLFDPHTVKLVLFSKQIKHWAYPELYTKEQFELEVQQAKELLYNL